MESFKNCLEEIILSTNELNHTSQFDKMFLAVNEFIKLGVTKDQLEKILSEIEDHIDMDDYQEDLYLEVTKAVGGYLSKRNNFVFPSQSL